MLRAGVAPLDISAVSRAWVCCDEAAAAVLRAETLSAARYGRATATAALSTHALCDGGTPAGE
jgi:hypothetical protein